MELTVTRKHFRSTGKDLQILVDKNKHNLDVLLDIFSELKHRKTKKMASLKEDVQLHIKVLNDKNLPIQKHTAPLTATTKKTSPSPLNTATTKKKSTSSSDISENIKKNNVNLTPKNERSDTTPNDGARNEQSQNHSLGEIRPCGNVEGAPKSFQPKLSDKLKFSFPEIIPLASKYAEVLEALLSEIRKKGTGMKAYELVNGRTIQLDGTRHGLKFEIEDEIDIFEGAHVRLDINGRQYDAQVVSASLKTILLSVEDNFGSLPRCTMRVESTAMLKALQERLSKLANEPSGFNFKLTEEVIFNTGAPQNKTSSFNNSDLNEKQNAAVASILSNPITYLWGPPGTGKTQTIAIAIKELFEKQKRVLICSNTNQAVDQVLLKICKTLGHNHSVLEAGNIVRIGQIHHQELKNEWSEYVSLEAIVARKSEHLIKELDAISAQIKLLDNQNKKNEVLISAFHNIDLLTAEIQELDKKKEAIIRIHRSSTNKEHQLEFTLGKLNAELLKREKAGTIKRLLSRSTEKILFDIDKSEKANHLQKKATAVAQKSLSDIDLLNDRKTLAANLDRFRHKVIKDNRKEILSAFESLKDKIRLKATERTKLQKDMEDIEKAVLDESKIIGSTITKLYLSASLFSEFDAIIIDEASMVQIPALYYAAGKSKEKVVISGDFRQLSPIVPTSEQAIFDEIGNDIFNVAGIQSAFENQTQLNRTVMLDTQYRMPKSVCSLISPRMYANRLKTDKKSSIKELPVPFNNNLVIVDTSSLTPFVNKRGSSKFNILNSITARNICIHLSKNKYSGSIGICTPYTAQRDLLNKVIKSEDLENTVETGTVHRFQGDEKDVIIFDIPDSYGEYYAGGFAQAELPGESGSKLFNVAISRSKGNVVIIANLEYLDQKLPANAFLREILHSIYQKGQVIDAHEILAFRPPVKSDFKVGQVLNLDLSRLSNGAFTQSEFDPIFLSDASTASESIVIYSGFITTSRVAQYEHFFRACISKGVVIRCITRPPSRNGSMSVADGKAALDKLEEIGCIVDTRWDIHEKLVLIDDKVVWIGSLNPLSHTSNTSEIMVRLVGGDVALQLACFMSISESIRPDQAAGHSGKKENPQCPNCQSRTVFRKGRYGNYWECESTCDWRASVNNQTKASTPKPIIKPEDVPTCPDCNKKMSIRDGRYGAFWGCSDYPKCKCILKFKL